MKSLQNNTFQKIVWLVAFVLLIASCRKENESLAPMRMFMPGSFDITSFTSSVLVTWDPSLYTSSTDTSITYTIEVSKDSTFQNKPFLTVTTDTTGVRLTDDTLEVRQKYFARVKANAWGDRPESEWIVSPGFKIQGIQLMLSKEIQVQSTSVQLKWQPADGITRVVLTTIPPTDPDTIQKEVSTEEAIQGVKEIDGLMPGTAYHVELYMGRKGVGYADLKTKPGLGDGTIIDLSHITGRPEVLMDTLSEVPDGSIIFLKRGGTYSLTEGYRFDKSMTIMSKPGFDKKAHVIFVGGTSMDLNEGSQVDSIVFDELILSGDYSSNYVLNVSKGGTIGKVIFDECEVRNFRGVFRIKASDPVTITDVIYNDCIIDSINGYGVMNVNNSAATVHNIRVRNTTISNAQVVFAGKSAGDSILVDRCTFYASPTGGKYTFDFGSNVINYIRLYSCIFGKGDGVKGYKAGDGTEFNVSSTFAASDYESKGNDLPGISLYNQPSEEIFKDPENGDFSIVDPNFPAIGDPRWQP